MVQGKLKYNIAVAVKALITLIVLTVILFPLVWLLLASIKSTEEIQQLPIRWFPQKPTIKPIIDVWLDPAGYSTNWLRYFFNTLLVTVITTAVVMSIGTIIGYGLARFRIPGASFILMVLLVAQLFTGPALMIPIYALIARINLYNTLTGLILVYIIFQTPFASWLSYSNFQNLPLALEESAAVDGCTPLRAFLQISLPLSRVGITTVSLMSFLLTWSEYPFAVVLLESEKNLTVSVGLAKFITAFNIYWNQMAAASLVIGVPVLVLLVFAQKYFVKGLTAGALK